MQKLIWHNSDLNRQYTNMQFNSSIKRSLEGFVTDTGWRRHPLGVYSITSRDGRSSFDERKFQLALGIFFLASSAT